VIVAVDIILEHILKL